MTKKEADRIEELEKKIDELLARPVVQPIVVQPYVPPRAPIYPLWNTASGGSALAQTFVQTLNPI